MKKIGILFCFVLSFAASAQTKFSNIKTQYFELSSDTLQISNVSINPFAFDVLKNGTSIDKKEYQINFEKSVLIINSKKHPKVTVQYSVYPDFLTKTYSPLDKKIIVPYRTRAASKFSFKNTDKKSPPPLEGLYTQGSLVRGISIGNSQDAVLNSSLDLQVSGKLTDKVTLRASITDSSIPIQVNGYSQNIEEFDRVFIELFSDNWSLKAGDVLLNNQETNFLKFDKKVSGLSVETNFKNENSETELLASGALVRGQFARQVFKGVEGNQGPYKLNGPNGELFIIILSGTETIFVNGIALKRGAQNDYTIDYNTAEITFTTTFPITANMRISAEFQYSDKNYTRFVTYNKAKYKSEKLKIGGYFYSENDSKNQPLQLNLSSENIVTLANAGNDTTKMFSSSGSEESFDENKIQYLKNNSGVFIYEPTNIESETYYNVNFHFVGNNQGSYSFLKNTPTGKVYEYQGENLGDYDPLTRLVAPNKLQVAVGNIEYQPSKKTNLKTEVAFSNNDSNLFSNIDDEENKGIATKVDWQQIYSDKDWLLQSTLRFDFLHENFKSIQRIYNVEFSRDWGISNSSGNQSLVQSEIFLSDKKDKEFTYGFELLKLGETYSGNRHNFHSKIRIKNTSFTSSTSFLNNSNQQESTSFLRAKAQIKHSFEKYWLGASLSTEDNKTKNTTTNVYNELSQKFTSYNTFIGIGDTTKVHSKIGVKFRNNDSIRNNKFRRTSSEKNFYIQSKVIKNKKSNLDIYANYRTVKNTFFENTNSLNSRISYRQKLFNNFAVTNTVYETSSGTLPQQEFTYIKTETGQGFYTWIDYNENGEQEFEEFEIAKFTDQANYLRVALPSVNYLKIHRNKFSQSLLLDAQQWNSKKGFQGFVSQFANQSYLLIDSKKKRIGTGFDLNPFTINDDNILGLEYNLKNSFFFRKGKQNYSTTYIFANSKIVGNLGIGLQENTTKLREIQFQHRVGKFWLIDVIGNNKTTENSSENFTDRNYTIDSKALQSKLTYKYSNSSNFSLEHEYKTKEEDLGFSNLSANRLGVSYQYSKLKKGSIIADFNYHKNNFEGDENSSIAYQILDGLQPGNNFVWNLLLQKKLNSYLDLNLNYSGRKSNDNVAIHVGNIQIRANF